MRRIVRLVANADAAADVDMREADAGGGELIDQLREPRRRRDERRSFGEKRANVAANTDRFDFRHARGGDIQTLRVAVRDAEFALAQPGRDVRMRTRVDVRIHAQRDRRTLAEPASDLRDALELRL